MEISVLASGSKGNVSYVATANTKLLIDLGISALSVEKKLSEIEIKPKDINGVLITHTHIDHINGLKVFIKKNKTKLYLTEKIYNELSLLFEFDNFEIINSDFSVNDISISIIKTSHDSSDSNGYIFESNNHSIAYITDTGYINNKHFKKLENRNIYVMESNHDVDLLMNGKYPYHLKQRILGDKGHLSNKDSAYYLSKFIGENTQKVILIHLSEENNDPKIALDTLEKTLEKNGLYFKDIVVSNQKERTELIKL